jgi:hypothetical protein
VFSTTPVKIPLLPFDLKAVPLAPGALDLHELKFLQGPSL